MTIVPWETGLPGIRVKRGISGPNDGKYGNPDPDLLKPHFTVFAGPGGTEENCVAAAKQVLRQHGGNAVVHYTFGGETHRQRTLV